jgi:hypothetical protein
MNRAAREWTKRSVDAAVYDALARELPASRVWSLLFDVFEARAAQRSPSALMEQWERDGFVAPAYIDQRTLVALDVQLLAAARDYEAIELSPLAPLGVCSVLGLTSQNRIVSALRGTEVVSDPTNVLALECARRLREQPSATVRLATSHRCVRAQPVPKQPGFARHFRIFCLASAGREREDHGFTLAAVSEHIHTMDAALDRLEQHGYAFGARHVSVFATDDRAALGDRIAQTVRGTGVTRARLEHPYYNGGLRFQIGVTAPDGAMLPMIDGGTFDWVGRLSANHRTVFVASGMGSQLAAFLCRRTGDDQDRRSGA